MLLSTPRQVRLVVVTLVVIAAILMIAVIPFIGYDMVNPIVKAQQARIEKFTAENNPQAPLLAYTVWLVSFFFPFWSTMSLIAGIVLLVIALPLFRGERWTRGLALLCLAIPAIGGAYMIVPWMNFIGSAKGGFPPAVTIMTIGLIPYFVLLLAEKVDATQKVVDFLVFLLLGVTAAENFANGHAAFRILFGHPARPLFAEGIAITYFGWLALWVAMGFCIAAIYLLGEKKVSGWYAGLIGGLVTLVASAATHYVRHATNDYLYGALMGVGIVVMLLIPVFKQRLLTEYSN
ncbi:MAG: hypothetical protein JETCAE02_10850 [Anaerolineaceae bacterium]|jgi:hypothetical protein|nr:hypothetical protein [Anaerolineales bacterium]MCC7512280.1 hypothetical protein [Anaerolineae bacterium]MDL1926230.1 hypothetical protein [Anaerolineae bacterium AMX1]NOG76386.1 hypothetical protein [Chloroflexota bacterium]GJQ38673.1 MAG: hypothetical protein JETCAE02_10850 [Anaerolineaceae bacterium]